MPLDIGLEDEDAFQHYSLGEFNDMCTKLTTGKKFSDTGVELDGEEAAPLIASYRSASFAATGKHPDTDVQAQISIDEYEIPNDAAGLSIRRDYDSLFLVTKTGLPYVKPVHLFTRNAWDQRLLDDVKFKAKFRDRNGVVSVLLLLFMVTASH